MSRSRPLPPRWKIMRSIVGVALVFACWRGAAMWRRSPHPEPSTPLPADGPRPSDRINWLLLCLVDPNGRIDASLGYFINRC